MLKIILNDSEEKELDNKGSITYGKYVIYTRNTLKQRK